MRWICLVKKMGWESQRYVFATQEKTVRIEALMWGSIINKYMIFNQKRIVKKYLTTKIHLREKILFLRAKINIFNDTSNPGYLLQSEMAKILWSLSAQPRPCITCQTK